MTRIAIVGAGGYARHHVSEFARLGAPVTALVDPSRAALDLMLADFPHTRKASLHESFDDFIRGPDADAVLISSPHTLHADQVCASFERGLHVLCDKPLTTSVADALRVIAARDASGRAGAVAYQRHGDGAWRWLRSVVTDGRFGRVRAVNSHLGQEWLQLTGGSWRQDLSLSGGGQLNDSGSHMLDVLLWATGLRASVVTAQMDYCGTSVDINSVVGVRFESGQLATVTVVGDAALWHERHFVWFEEAMVELSDGTATVHQRDGLRFKVDRFPAGPGVQENFLQAVAGEVEPLAPFECGLCTIELTEAAWRSHAQGGAPVHVN